MACTGHTIDDVMPAMLVSQPRSGDEAEDACEPSVVVLIVDDNAKKRLALTSVLAPLGYHIVEADSGIAALRRILERDFAVILLDVRMPIMDGFETAALIRQRRQSELTPIIFITANGSDEIARTDRYAQGAVDFIFSPINPADLRAKVSVFANLFIRAELLARQARAVQATADQLRLLIDAAPIGIFQTDADNRDVYTNVRWSEICGVPAEEAIGQKLGSLHRTRTSAVGQALPTDPDMFEADVCQRIEILVSGASRIVHATSKSIPDGRGGTAGRVGTLADVTAEAGAEAAMSQARDAALAASATQTSFAASASHDLRTPSTSILGYTEVLLESTSLCDLDRQHLEVVHRSAQRLAQLIPDPLVVAESEIGATVSNTTTSKRVSRREPTTAS